MRIQQIVTLPVYGLRLGPKVRNEVTVGRVQFVASSKLARIRKRLGIPQPISYYRDKLSDRRSYDIFSNSETYAVIKTCRHPDSKDLTKELGEIQTAFWILASSFAFRNRRYASMTLQQVSRLQLIRDIMVFDRDTSGWHGKFQRRPNLFDSCDGFWVMNAKYNHFRNLQKIVDGRLNVNSKWKSSLERAAALYGQSYLATRLADAFANNMIAIETLLSIQGDKFPDSLIDRIVALFGWLHNEDRRPWEECIRRLYKLRSCYVHDGQCEQITGMDLEASDVILQNLLTNLCGNTRTIKEKSDIVMLAKEIAAYETLGMKPKRKAALCYSQRVYTDDIIAEINDTHSWEW